MTYPAALLASCLRGALVMVIGIVVARLLAQWHQSTESRGVRKLQLILLTATFLTPNLIVGFGYRTLSINLLNQRWLNELLYFALICFEFVPAPTWLILHSPPPSLSAKAWHVAKLAAQKGGPLATLQWRLRLWWKGVGETLAGPAALLFVLAFQESELAALMQVAGWPERLFTDHVKGGSPIQTIKLVAWPVAIQLPFVIPLLSRLGNTLSSPALSVLADRTGVVRRTWWLQGFGWAWVAAGAGFVIAQPLWHLVDGIMRVGGTIVLQPKWRREVGDAVLLAATCVAVTRGIAWLIGKLWSRDGSQPRRLEGLLMVTCIPGLVGTLALGLLTAGFFQRFVPRLAYTPMPLVLAECLWLWPRVVLVRESIAARTRVAAHQIRQLSETADGTQRTQAKALWWRISGRSLAGGMFLIGWWAYLEVMLPMILSLPGFQPAPMMMYNHLHYAQVEALGVKLAMILSVPLVLWLAASAVLKVRGGGNAA